MIFHVVLLHVLIHLVSLTAGQPDFLYHFCVNDGNYTENSAYRANLNTLLSSLSSNVNAYGFYNASEGQNSDRANAIVLCRGDVQLDTCRACVQNATQKIREVCPNQKAAVGWYDYCMVRYSNNSIIGVKTSAYSFFMWNPQNASNVNEFNTVLRNLLDGLRDEAANAGSSKKFATGNRPLPDFQTIYALVQCTPDLSAEDCRDCLTSSAENIPICCDGKRGGRVVGQSCNLRFEPSRFYNETTPEAEDQPSGEGDDGISSRLIVIIILSVAAFVILGICLFILIRRIKKRTSIERVEALEDISTVESLQYDFNTVSVATGNFADTNKLGQGGFGAVYKGKLPNGQEIAVKRLSRDSGQGDLEFKNEVLLVARLQHRNLVRLLGFCLEGTERLLIYEYMPNASLDHFIFDSFKRSQVKWDERHKIIRGVARGLVYLHEDSRLRIIHRDLKASNVLLDEEMNPKISDFGMARLFVLDETQGNTSRVVGTYGYMAPEYALHGLFSPKSDVFSYGVLVLEIVSGQRNSCFRSGEHIGDLLSHVWKNWRDGTVENVIDPIIMANSALIHELLRCIHIGLLCVQENVADRPSMASVLIMLNSFSLTLPVPSEPAFFMQSGMESSTVSIPADQENDSRLQQSTLLPRDRSVQQPAVDQASIITEIYPR